MAEARVVLDASALLALLQGERGAESLADGLAESAISAVNLSEVAAKLAEAGLPELELREALGPLGLEVVPFDEELAYRAGLLRPATRGQGLSLGDRACLALARARGLPAVTTDRAWKKLALGVEVRVLR